MKPYRAAELLIEKIKKDYREDIAIVVVMGSHLYQETHAKSDLDLYFIPKTERGFQLGTVFIIDGIGYDFWPITWERIARIASHDERLGAIITEGKIIYHGNEEDLLRFEEYRKIARQSDRIGHFIWKAKNKIKASYEDYVLLHRSSDISDARYYAIRLLYDITESLSLLNRITIKRGRGKLLKEMLSMPLLPSDFEKDYRLIFDSESRDMIVSAALGLFDRTNNLIVMMEKQDKDGSFKQEATGFYEELINCYNKIERAYEIQDDHAALLVAAEMRMEIEGMLEHRGVDLSNLPDLLKAYHPHDLQKLYELSKVHQKRLESLLAKEGVSIRKFQGEHDLKAYLDTL